MDKNIILRDGEIAVVIDNASIIMNVNTALEVIEKLNARNTKIDCTNDALKNINKNSKPDNVCLNDNTKDFKPNKNFLFLVSFARILREIGLEKTIFRSFLSISQQYLISSIFFDQKFSSITTISFAFS